jgi:hypothetical protein
MNPARLDRPDRHIALLQSPGVGTSAHAIQLFESMLWVFQGVTRFNWITVPSPDAADGIVLHEADRDERIARWRERKGSHHDRGADRAIPRQRARTGIPLPCDAGAGAAQRAGSKIHEEQRSGPANTHLMPGDKDSSTDPGHFLKSLRTLREVQSSHPWLAGKLRASTVLWLRGDGRKYCADPETLQSLRRGTLNVNGIDLRVLSEMRSGQMITYQRAVAGRNVQV